MNTKRTSLVTANVLHDVCDPTVFSCTTPYEIIKLLVIFRILENVNRFICLDSGAMSKMLL